VYSHLKWLEWIEEKMDVTIDYPVIADSYGRVSDRLGTIHPPGSEGSIRAVFIVDKAAKIRCILYYPKGVGRNLDELIRIMNALQITDREGVATPANWPNNEIIGDHVLIHPPSDGKGARERKNDKDCYDWWFCHKKLE
jgi:peroxiredoxin (alkyl hydroperoxide reductase subunit C)